MFCYTVVESTKYLQKIDFANMHFSVVFQSLKVNTFVSHVALNYQVLIDQKEHLSMINRVDPNEILVDVKTQR